MCSCLIGPATCLLDYFAQKKKKILKPFFSVELIISPFHSFDLAIAITFHRRRVAASKPLPCGRGCSRGRQTGPEGYRRPQQIGSTLILLLVTTVTTDWLSWDLFSILIHPTLSRFTNLGQRSHIARDQPTFDRPRQPV